MRLATPLPGGIVGIALLLLSRSVWIIDILLPARRGMKSVVSLCKGFEECLLSPRGCTRADG